MQRLLQRDKRHLLSVILPTISNSNGYSSRLFVSRNEFPPVQGPSTSLEMPTQEWFKNCDPEVAVSLQGRPPYFLLKKNLTLMSHRPQLTYKYLSAVFDTNGPRKNEGKTNILKPNKFKGNIRFFKCS